MLNKYARFFKPLSLGRRAPKHAAAAGERNISGADAKKIKPASPFSSGIS
jgi:hypothetical protein